MSNEEQFIIIVRFPAWEMDGKKYKAFGMKYLFKMPIIPLPEWEDDDKRWFGYDEGKIVVQTFSKAFKEKIGRDFDGEVLFVEPASYTVIESDEVVGAEL